MLFFYLPMIMFSAMFEAKEKKREASDANAD